MKSTIDPSGSKNAPDMKYREALELVMGLADFERSTTSPGHSTFHLERMTYLMGRLGDVHLKVPTVHVAGTKGKGSTSAMIASMLTSHGYKVGFYSSPHLHSAVERIRIGQDPIKQEEFAGVVAHIWPVIEEVALNGGYGPATTFETMTAMAFVHFHNVAVDFQVMEVGLGGRLDSTNIVLPEVSVITSISLDHMATLGDTIEKIAFEKAGIIKPGVPVVVAPQCDEAMAVFLDVAEQRGAPLVSVKEQLSWRETGISALRQTFQIKSSLDKYDLEMPLLGEYQLENAATAIATMETLAAGAYMVNEKLSKKCIGQGLRNVRWPARLEVLPGNSDSECQIVVDGAHNPYSVSRLVEALPKYFQYDRVFLVFGALGGHSARDMIKELETLEPVVFTARSRHPRSSLGSEIADIVAKEGIEVAFQAETVAEAFRSAIKAAGPRDIVLGTGSLAVAAEIREELLGISPELYPNMKPVNTKKNSLVSKDPGSLPGNSKR